MLVKLRCGVVASIHTDMFGRDHKRDGDYGEQEIFFGVQQKTLPFKRFRRESKKFYKKFPNDFNLNYIRELKHFVAYVVEKKVLLL